VYDTRGYFDAETLRVVGFVVCARTSLSRRKVAEGGGRFTYGVDVNVLSRKAAVAPPLVWNVGVKYCTVGPCSNLN
jgi:hypothetical protein